MTEFKDIIEEIVEVCSDISTPKGIKEKLNQISELLKQDIEESLKVNKALHELDEIVNDNNMEPYTRTQIWNLVSMLEGL